MRGNDRLDEFCYLGSMITPCRGATEGVKSRINKAKAALTTLSAPCVDRRNNIEESKIKSVLLFACETRRVT